MIIIPEQLSYLREQREKVKESLATYKDYLQNKEITSSDYSSRAYIGDSFIDEQFHRERKQLRDITTLLTTGVYLRERQLDQIGIGTKFVIQFDGMDDTDTIILTDCVYGLAIDRGFVSTESILGQSILGKKEGDTFKYVVQTGKSYADKRSISGKVLEIKKDYDDYIHYLTEKPKCLRMSKPEKRKLHALLNDDSKEAQKELASYHTITQSQQYILELEADKLKGKRDPHSISRLAIVRKLLTSSVITNIEPGVITVGSKFDLAILSPKQELTTCTYEMINSAVSDELEDAYVERISPLGTSIYGLHEHDTFKFRKDNKTYTGEVIKIHQKQKEDEYTKPHQYTKK